MIAAASAANWSNSGDGISWWAAMPASALAASLFAILLFVQAPATGGGGLPSLAQLAQPNGLIHGVNRAAVLLGIVAFGIAASQIASEYSLGTFVNSSSASRGAPFSWPASFSAVLCFMLGAVVFSSAGGHRGGRRHGPPDSVPTAAWTSSTGIADLTRALGDLLLATVGFATFGSGRRPPVPFVGHRRHRGFRLSGPGRSVVVRIAPHDCDLAARVSSSSGWRTGGLGQAGSPIRWCSVPSISSWQWGRRPWSLCARTSPRSCGRRIVTMLRTNRLSETQRPQSETRANWQRLRRS